MAGRGSGSGQGRGRACEPGGWGWVGTGHPSPAWASGYCGWSPTGHGVGWGSQGLCCWGRLGCFTPCGFMDLRAAIFKGLKGALSLRPQPFTMGACSPAGDVISSAGNVSAGGGGAEATSWSGAATKHLLSLSFPGAQGRCPPTVASVGLTASPPHPGPVASLGQEWCLLQRGRTEALLGAPHGPWLGPQLWQV